MYQSDHRSSTLLECRRKHIANPNKQKAEIVDEQAPYAFLHSPRKTQTQEGISYRFKNCSPLVFLSRSKLQLGSTHADARAKRLPRNARRVKYGPRAVVSLTIPANPIIGYGVGSTTSPRFLVPSTISLRRAGMGFPLSLPCNRRSRHSSGDVVNSKSLPLSPPAPFPPLHPQLPRQSPLFPPSDAFLGGSSQGRVFPPSLRRSYAQRKKTK